MIILYLTAIIQNKQYKPMSNSHISSISHKQSQSDFISSINFYDKQHQQIQFPQLPKIKCAFHHNQYITNFCTCQSCLLPLCPSCIKIHTNQHVNNQKLISPQYQPITQLLEQTYLEVQDLLESQNQFHRNITELDTKIVTFCTAIQQKIISVKNSIITEIQKYFDSLNAQINQQINKMTYVKSIKSYRSLIKTNIIGLKNIVKQFNPQNNKIMRVLIKYKTNNIKKQIEEYQKNLSKFMKQVNNNFVTFSVREDYKNILNNYLDSIKKIQISDMSVHEKQVCEVNVKKGKKIFGKIKQVYEKQEQKMDNKNTNANKSQKCKKMQNPKEMIRSLNSLLQPSSSINNNSKNNKKYHNLHAKNSQKTNNHQISQSSCTYNSVCNQIRAMNENQNRLLVSTPPKNYSSNNNQNKQYHSRKRSISKGKGLSIIQQNNRSSLLSNNLNNFNTSNLTSMQSLNSINSQYTGQINRKNQQRAINICQPMEFHRTTIISRNQMQ